MGSRQEYDKPYPMKKQRLVFSADGVERGNKIGGHIMKALCYHGPHDIRCDDMEDAIPTAPGDAVVKMEACAICGSDLHIYHGSLGGGTGFCVGHEAVGEVVEVGKGVNRVKVGDRVMISAATGCGACTNCLSGKVAKCLNGQSGCYGLSANLQGCQSEFIRVPVADFNTAPIPEGLTAEQALMLTDNLPTAHMGVLNADVKPGGRVAVIGLGPIGLMAVELCVLMGAAQVFALDLVPERRAVAEKLGAIPVDPANAFEAIGEATKGRMVDSAIEAVGSDVTIKLAIDLAGFGGTVSAFGVNLNQDFKYPLGSAFTKGLTFRIAGCSVPEHWPTLVPLMQEGRLKPEAHITHRMTLAEGTEAYRMFDQKEDGAMKMIFTA